MQVGTALDAPTHQKPGEEAHPGRRAILPDESKIRILHAAKDAEIAPRQAIYEHKYSNLDETEYHTHSNFKFLGSLLVIQ
jgi:hypothetical protein